MGVETVGGVGGEDASVPINHPLGGGERADG